MNIAIDIESTMAAVTPEFITEFNHQHGTDYDPEREIGDWLWMERDGICSVEEFLTITEHLWNNQWQTIPTREPGLFATTAQMAAQHHVDVVTSREGCDEAMEQWLDAHGIVYETLYTAVEDKTSLSRRYDVFFDDKPAFAEKLVDSDLYLIDHPYNEGVSDKPNVHRVDTVAEGWADMTLPDGVVKDVIDPTPLP